MAQAYRDGIETEKDLNAAIKWQKIYRDILKAQYTDIYDDSIHILIEAENDLAEMELENGNIKEARNSCWKGLYLCSFSGRGSFYSSARIPYYAKLYMLLGDVFLKRSDEKQAIECYANDLPVYMKLAEEAPNNCDILLNACRCFLNCIIWTNNSRQSIILWF
jgi:tetratricopeptide (TPR) repeat protein